MKKLINKYNYNALDSTEIRLAKSLILLIAVFCCICGVIWGYIFYCFLGFGLTSSLPLLFVILVFPTIVASHYFSNYRILVHMQLICITLIPCLIQWSLGTVHDSGFILTWCFLGPLGALVYLNNKYAIFWMLVFIFIVVISVIFVPKFSEDALLITDNFRSSLYLMNVLTPFVIIFIAGGYFYNGLNVQRKKNLLLLKSTKEKNIRIEKSLEREKELGQLKSSFVTVASHQFRTPLAVIQSNTELLEMLNNMEEKQESEKYKKVTNRITVAISKMTNLMDDVLTLGKLTAGKVSYIPKELDLVEFCKELAEEFNAVQLDGRSIDFITKGEAYKIYLDAKLLEHTLSNLISNAFKYSTGNVSPQLSIDFKSTEVVLSVKDYGLGIPEKEQLHLFEPFFRADNVTEIQGTGLGLSIAKEYVEVNKGSISAKSTLGEGSCFEISFKREM